MIAIKNDSVILNGHSRIFHKTTKADDHDRAASLIDTCTLGSATQTGSAVDIKKAAEIALKNRFTGSPGELLWAFGAGTKINSTPYVDDKGNLYFGSLNKHVYALDGSTGKKIWDFESGGALVSSSPAAGPGDSLFISCTDGKLYALDRITGKKKWDFQTEGKISSSPSVGRDGTVYFNGGDSTLYALEGTSGTLKWAFPLTEGNDTHSSPALGADGTVYIGTDDGRVFAVNGDTGSMKWQHKTGKSGMSSPALGRDGTVYIGGNFYGLYAIDGATGKKKWEFETKEFTNVRPAVADDGTVYIGGDTSRITAIDGATGKKIWTRDVEGRGTSSPAFRDGVVYVHVGKGCTDNNIYALDGQTGDIRWSFAPGGPNRGVGSDPAFGINGEVYVGNDDGFLYALKGCTPPETPSEVLSSNAAAETGEEDKPTIEEENGFITIDGVKLPCNTMNYILRI